MTIREGSESMIVSRQSRIGVSVSASIKGDDCDVEGWSALLTGFQQSETLSVVKLVHDSRGYATRIEKSQSCEWFDGPQQYPQSAEALRVESVRMVETEPSEQDNKSAESGKSVKTGCSTVRGNDREWGISSRLLADTRLLRTKRWRNMREIFVFFVRVKEYGVLQLCILLLRIYRSQPICNESVIIIIDQSERNNYYGILICLDHVQQNGFY